MRIHIDPQLESERFRPWLARLKRANEILGEITRPSTENVLIDWRLAPENHKPHFRLALAKPPDRVEADIAGDDLEDENGLRRTLIRLWGDVLEVRSHRLVQDLLELEGAT